MSTTFIVKVGDLSVLPTIRYVITLDADTVLPREAARQLIGTLAHPLNQAEFDPAHRRDQGRSHDPPAAGPGAARRFESISFHARLFR